MKKIMINKVVNGVTKVYKNGEAKALNVIMSGRKKIKERIKSKGGLNVLEIIVIAVVVLVVTYPFYKDYLTNFTTQAKTWFSTQQNSIFK